MSAADSARTRRRLWPTAGGLAGVLAALLTGCATVRPPPDTAAVERILETTGYCPCGQCCGWRRTCWGVPVVAAGPAAGRRKRVGITASGTRARKGTIAADTTRYPFGTVMYIEDYGYGRVEDTGSALRGDHIDLFFRSHRAAQEWGRQWKKARIWFPSARQLPTHTPTR